MTPYIEKLLRGVLLRCLSREEATYVLNEVHAKVCGAHQAGPKLANQMVQNLLTRSKGWAIIGQLWFKTQWNLSNTWRFHTPATTITLPKHIVQALPCMGTQCDRTDQCHICIGFSGYFGFNFWGLICIYLRFMHIFFHYARFWFVECLLQISMIQA